MVLKCNLVRKMNYLSLLLISFLFFGFSCSTKNSKKSDCSSKWYQLVSKQLMGKWDSIAVDSNGWDSNNGILARAIYLCNGKENYPFFKTYEDRFLTPKGELIGYKSDKEDLTAYLNGRNLLLIYQQTKDIKYLKAIEILVKQIKKQPQTADGGWGYTKTFPKQLRLESTYRVCPFLAEYAMEFNQKWALDEAIRQLLVVYKHNLDSKTGLLYHAWDESHKAGWCNPNTGQSYHFWSRSMGLYCMAVVDVLDYLPEDYPARKQLIEIVQNTSKAILRVQDTERGLWYQVLNMGDREGNYLETSGSAEFAYVFAKGYKKGFLPNSYWIAAQKAFNGITDKMIEQDDSGNYNFTHISGPCNLDADGSYKYYITEKVILNAPEGIAPFLLAGKELTL